MIAYKAFAPGLKCLGYQFVMGRNVTEKANCRANGFHCAANPLDCLSYYPDMYNSVYCLVDARGDINEDGSDTKIACTELVILKKLSREDFFLHALAYMADHPKLSWNSHVTHNQAIASCGYAVVRGSDPVACGMRGDILALAQEGADSRTITKIAITTVDGTRTLPGRWYNIDFMERKAR